VKTASRKLHRRFKNRTRAGAGKRVTTARRACTVGPANCVENYDSIYETASDPGYIDEPVIRIEPAASETLYYSRNQQYSVTALTSSTGTVVERYAYSAYGEPKFFSGTGTVLTDSARDSRYTYTGRECDKAIGLYHFRARMYDAESGRFCGRDPIGFKGGGKNFYALLSLNPLDGTDPTGTRTMVIESTRRRSPCLCGEMISCISAWGPIWCLLANTAGDEAFEESIQVIINGPVNGKADAVRHCIWSCKT
jgi:RHS repeat-associated protein